MKIYPSKEATWEQVLSALRSGEYTQTRKAMCTNNAMGTDPQFDVLGIVALVAGAKFELHGPDNRACDQNGETEMPSPEVLERFGLNRAVGAEDYEKAPEIAASLRFFYPEGCNRAEVLAYMGDQVGMRFHRIADEIERLGWNE